MKLIQILKHQHHPRMMPNWQLALCILPNFMGFIAAAITGKPYLMGIGTLTMLALYFASKAHYLAKHDNN